MHEIRKVFAIRLPESAHLEQVDEIDYVRMPDDHLVPLSAHEVLRPLMLVGEEILDSCEEGIYVRWALEGGSAESDPIEDIIHFTTCVTYGFFPPAERSGRSRPSLYEQEPASGSHAGRADY